jgi:hypothetical protein
MVSIIRKHPWLRQIEADDPGSQTEAGACPKEEVNV